MNTIYKVNPNVSFWGYGSQHRQYLESVCDWLNSLGDDGAQYTRTATNKRVRENWISYLNRERQFVIKA